MFMVIGDIKEALILIEATDDIHREGRERESEIPDHYSNISSSAMHKTRITAAYDTQALSTVHTC